MPRKMIIIGNWKMNPVFAKEAKKIYEAISKALPSGRKSIVAICPPYIYLESLKKSSKKIFLGAQDVFGENSIGGGGPFTGEVSPEMLYELGARFVILGHSERRRLFGENDEDINKKVKATLSAGLTPILCVGEKERDEAHEYFFTVKEQLEKCLKKIPKNSLTKVIVAYEPIWALSTTAGRRDATPEDFKEMAIYIRKVLADKFGVKTELPRIIYGGSVSPKNAYEFLVEGEVEGFLVGKESLNPKNFVEIVKICDQSGI